MVIVAAREPALIETLQAASKQSASLVESDLLLVPICLDDSGAGGAARAAPPAPELLAGQSLQGELTSRECSAAIEQRWGAAQGARRFPLFSTVRAVFDGKIPPESVLRYRAAAKELAREAELGAAAKEEKRGEKKREQQAREPALEL